MSEPSVETCPHCRSTAGAVPYYAREGNKVKRLFDGGAHEGELVCDACGGARGREGAGSGDEPKEALGRALRDATLARTRGGALRGFGIASIGIGTLFALALVGSGLGTVALVGAAVAVGFGAALGAVSIRAASRGARRADERLARAFEATLLETASAHGFRLTATQAARSLGIGVAEADRALTAMADGSRVSAELDQDGIVVFEFRELQRALGEPVRVEALEAAPDEVVDAVAPGGDGKQEPEPESA